MADNVKPTYAKSSVKSGLENEKYSTQVLEGPYPKKNVEAIEAENTVKNCSGSVMQKASGKRD
jgi:hypothetical protein